MEHSVTNDADAPEPAAETVGFLTAVDDLSKALLSETALQTLLSRVEQQARAHVADLATETGRAAVRSNAFKVVRSRTALEAAAKDITEDWRTKTAMVNEVRKAAVQRLDALRDEVRKPLDDWETAEDARKADQQTKLDSLKPADVRGWTSEQIQAEIDRIAEVRVDGSWAEVKENGQAMKQTVLADLGRARADAMLREDEQAELARFRAERAAREKQEAERSALLLRLETLRAPETSNLSSGQIATALKRIEAIEVDTWGEFQATAEALRCSAIATLTAALAASQAREAEDARTRQEAIETERRQAEERAAQAAREEAERAAQAQIAAAELAARDAEKRAQQEREAAAERERLAAAKAEQDRLAAVDAERQRQAQAEAAAAAARLAREADEKLRATARAKIIAALVKGKGLSKIAGGKELKTAIAGDVADQIMSGLPNCEFRP